MVGQGWGGRVGGGETGLGASFGGRAARAGMGGGTVETGTDATRLPQFAA